MPAFPAMTYLLPTIDSFALTFSVGIACLTTLVLLDLAARVHGNDRGIAHVWWLGGSVVGGTGLWAMHFLGMSSRVLPIPIGYAAPMTVVSWLCGVGAASLLLSLAMRRKLHPLRLLGSGAVVGVVVCMMYHTGMAAIELAPGVVWDGGVAAAAAAISVGLMAALLFAMLALRDAAGWKPAVVQAGVAVGVGMGLARMHELAMSAANVPAEAVSFSALALDGSHLVDLTTITVPLMLFATLLSSRVYGWVDQRRSQLAGSLENVAARLETANDELRQRAMLDPLTDLPNRTITNLHADRKSVV